MTEVATSDMCAYCFDALINHLDHKTMIADPSFANSEYPIFVTWNKKGHLRGCIGTFSPLPIHEGLKEYSIISATQDSRFSPVSISEVKDMSVSVSLMHSFEDCSKWDDWIIGTHGIRVKLISGGRSYGATYLPDVMPEQGWNHEEAVESCLQKGGFMGSFTDSVKEKVHVTRYQTAKKSMSYNEYVQWKKAKE
ncbi:putative AMME syndrome candidate 1 protein [Monocercomonoides exilis]|uniref:putative AMME syndrome candidate 1 protein n=1 Tax=Monocercomonoides exilis TaxID=2049356 RepID=UPI0035595C00|nr:putative AMME syndrome candidate 1 protein [Monocercomonoides exilis]|eukprot:MONOS_719.1-p1 / transcript=MONOS_719.1 / gene=MONOS_719 / organism=Monocercomonoides_exilis_PA203 / gene_product=AMME syndrome candidate 1 protein / transcript_product=AMME syndrome candidate 1 protein / location=Mono_scaffold00012:71800-72577(+) / protein_length=193 / sequence_SO=supercontig / SO=protein_coding / is_pseudo=false